MYPLRIDSQFLDLTHIPQGLECFVDGGKGNGGVDLEDLPVNVLSGGVIPVVLEQFEYTESLGRDFEAGIPEPGDNLVNIPHFQSSLPIAMVEFPFTTKTNNNINH